MKEQLIQLIVERLGREQDALAKAFQASKNEVGVRYCAVDDLLPQELAERIHRAFPQPSAMRLMESFRERKYTSKSFDQFDPLMADITFAVQDPRVVEVVEQITGIREQIPDASLYAGGLSAMVKGHHLGPHIDNSHEASRRYYRTLNLLYYVTPGWALENGGNLELWDEQVRKNVTIVSRFNRLAIMETTPTSWHSVSPVVADGTRCCVSNYYFSPRSPTGQDYFNVTSFSARPEQPLLRLLARVDNGLRQGVRALVPQGLGKKDVYEGPKP
ncbi:2OG-Fe(II) oxygenase [Roseateles puraquae]|uniref:2OG-Fe(II) oxygenase n=1 Tax=Roseateles puraquae TaxID=431059 RepID=UPI0031CEE23A